MEHFWPICETYFCCNILAEIEICAKSFRNHLKLIRIVWRFPNEFYNGKCTSSQFKHSYIIINTKTRSNDELLLKVKIVEILAKYILNIYVCPLFCDFSQILYFCPLTDSHEIEKPIVEISNQSDEGNVSQALSFFMGDNNRNDRMLGFFFEKLGWKIFKNCSCRPTAVIFPLLTDKT